MYKYNYIEINTIFRHKIFTLMYKNDKISKTEEKE